MPRLTEMEVPRKLSLHGASSTGSLTDLDRHAPPSPADSMPPPSPSSVSSAGSLKLKPRAKGSQGGRAPASFVWEYFGYDKLSESSKCKVPDCSYSSPGKNTGNLVSHLKAHHREQYNAYTAKEKTRKESTEKKQESQQTLIPVPVNSKPYRPGEQRYKEILRALALVIALSTSPYSFVELDVFRLFCKILDPRCPDFGRKTVIVELEALWSKLKERLRQLLENAGLIAISIDVWTKKGMTESFLGLNVHFVDAKTKETHHFTLVCRSFPSPHTAENVYRLVKGILEEWNISPERVSAVLTDNGSNMVCAFKHFVALSLAIRDEEMFPVSDTDEMYMLSTSDPLDDAAVDTEARQFLDCEEDENRLYAEYNRLPCFIHTLQLVVRVFEKSGGVKDVMKKVRSLVTAFNKSAKATTALIQLAKKKLIGDVSTRWNSVLLMVRRLLEVKDHVRKVIVDENLKVSDLSPSERKILEGVELLLGKFELVTEKMSAQYVSTIHMVVPFVREISHHLAIHSTKDAVLELDAFGLDPVFEDIVHKMEEEMKTRFRYVLDKECPKFTPLYTAANFLHEVFRDYLAPEELQVARAEITRFFLLRQRASDKFPLVESFSEGDSVPNQNQPAQKKQKICELGYLASLPNRAPKPAAKVHPTTAQLVNEIDLYCGGSVTSDLGQGDDPRMFWKAHASVFPLLSLVALDILAIGSGTADVERLFSTARLVSSGRRNRLRGSRLEMETFIKKNLRYLD